MRDHEDGRLAVSVELLELLEQQARVLGVEGAGGLVGHDDGGLGDERPGGGDALLLATRHLVGVLVEDLADAQAGGRLLDASEHLAGRDAGDGERQGHVFPCGQGVQQVGVLEDEAELLAPELRERAAAQPCHLAPAHEHVAACGRVDGRDAVEQRGLAGARSAHD